MGAVAVGESSRFRLRVLGCQVRRFRRQPIAQRLGRQRRVRLTHLHRLPQFRRRVSFHLLAPLHRLGLRRRFLPLPIGGIVLGDVRPTLREAKRRRTRTRLAIG